MEIDPHEAINFIARTAPKYAEAKGQMYYLENFLKTVKAQEMNRSDSSSLGQREADAYESQAYRDANTAYKAAVEEEAHLKWLMTAAQARVEVWKTQQYNLRQELKNIDMQS